MKRPPLTLLAMAMAMAMAMVLMPVPGLSQTTDSRAKAGAERWRKVDASGRELPTFEGPWSCVLDRQTGLLWENKSDNEGPRYTAATYSWHEPTRGLGVARGGSCLTSQNEHLPCDTHMQVSEARQRRWCGRADWRLPTLAELKTLLHDTGYAGAPMIATGYFPHTGRLAYWTADLVAHPDGQRASLLHFHDGQVLALPLNSAARLRLVSGPAPR